MFIEGFLCARDNARNWKDKDGRARCKCAWEFTFLREIICTQIVHCNTVKKKKKTHTHTPDERTWPQMTKNLVPSPDQDGGHDVRLPKEVRAMMRQEWMVEE